MNLVHLTSSTFFGGPERQMLGLAEALPGSVRTTFVSFAEGGRCAAFLDEVRARGFDTVALKNDFPKVLPAVRELTGVLRGCDVLLCHGYKANILGRIAARRVGIPAVAVSRGWTGENRKVKAYEWLDRWHLRFMDRVVCVSDGQAAKVRRWCRVPESRISVVRNSARLAAFENADPDARRKLLAFCRVGTAHHAATAGGAHPTSDNGLSLVVLAAGRLSPEKGFGVLVEAAAAVCRKYPAAGVVLFGDGVLRPELEARVAALGLTGRVVLPGFRTDLDSLITAADVVVLPSFTEGLPNVALEASAAGVPVVATAVGGTPEVIADAETGFLVPPGNPGELAAKIVALLQNPALRSRMGEAGRRRMRDVFTFDAQAAAYMKLFDSVLALSPTSTPV